MRLLEVLTERKLFGTACTHERPSFYVWPVGGDTFYFFGQYTLKKNICDQPAMQAGRLMLLLPALRLGYAPLPGQHPNEQNIKCPVKDARVCIARHTKQPVAVSFATCMKFAVVGKTKGGAWVAATRKTRIPGGQAVIAAGPWPS